MAPQVIRSSLVSFALALLTGVFGTAARADALYTVTNLGSGGVTLTTAGGGTIAVSAIGSPAGDLATSQLASVSDGQVSYAFDTAADAALSPGQAPLSGIPSEAPLGTVTSPAGYYVGGLLNTNGVAAVVGTATASDNPTLTFSTTYAAQQSSGGAWGEPTAIIASGLSYPTSTGGYMTVAGLNAANQALIGTAYNGVQSDALVYNVGTHTLTDLAQLPQFSNGAFSNLVPLAIDNQGQVLVVAAAGGTTDLDILLLTPSGEPIVTTPEPGTWIIWPLILGASCIAARRATPTP